MSKLCKVCGRAPKVLIKGRWTGRCDKGVSCYRIGYNRLNSQKKDNYLEIRPTMLTFAAEEIGRAFSGKDMHYAVLDFLLCCARHSNQVVREGAIYGLEFHMRDSRVKDFVTKMAVEDRSKGVRLAAQDVLDGQDWESDD